MNSEGSDWARRGFCQTRPETRRIPAAAVNTCSPGQLVENGLKKRLRF